MESYVFAVEPLQLSSCNEQWIEQTREGLRGLQMHQFKANGNLKLRRLKMQDPILHELAEGGPKRLPSSPLRWAGILSKQVLLLYAESPHASIRMHGGHRLP